MSTSEQSVLGAHRTSALFAHQRQICIGLFGVLAGIVAATVAIGLLVTVPTVASGTAVVVDPAGPPAIALVLVPEASARSLREGAPAHLLLPDRTVDTVLGRPGPVTEPAALAIEYSLPATSVQGLAGRYVTVPCLLTTDVPVVRGTTGGAAVTVGTRPLGALFVGSGIEAGS